MLSACNSLPVTKNVPTAPPVALYSESTERAIPAPQRGSSNADLVAYIRSLKEALAAAYADRKAIREWAAGVTSGQAQ